MEQKTAKNEYINHPDFPDKAELRMYYMYDTTAWSMKSENIQEKHLAGKTERLSGEAAASLAEKMASSALPGPAAFAKAPVLNFNLTGPPPPAAPSAKRRAKQAEGL